MAEDTRCGVVALAGPPNAGKSTLLNRMVGSKISIVTHKVQTTRAQIRGIGLDGNCQIIFVDTPGIFKPRRRLERAMVDAAWAGVGDADVSVVLVDAARGVDEDVDRIVKGQSAAGRTAVLALNKVDLVRREELLALAQRLNESGVFSDIFMISALDGDGVKDLQAHLTGRMPKGPWLYPEDQIADLPQRLLAAEVTREKAFLNLHDELPYELTVATESWQDFKDGSARIEQTITVARDSQKGIVLGRGGQTIKRIRTQAQADLEQDLQRSVHLFIRVKVRSNWAEDPEQYQRWGLRYDA
ncbi:MAG: GTPase Era [Alphaproteobacteria bacterium]